MKSRRIQKQSTRHIKSVALQKCKKQLSRRRKSIRRGGGSKKSAKASVKAPQGLDIDDIKRKINILILGIDSGIILNNDSEITEAVNALIKSVGNHDTQIDIITRLMTALDEKKYAYNNNSLEAKLNELQAAKAAEESKVAKSEANASIAARIAAEEAEARETKAREAIKAREAREAEAKRKVEEARRKVEEARRKVEEAKINAEEEAKRKAEEVRKKVEEAKEARKKVEEAKEAKKKIEEELKEAKKKIEEEAKRKAEEEAKRKVEEEAKRKVEEEAKRKVEEEARRKAEEEARRKAEEEARRKAEEEARRKAEEESLKIDNISISMPTSDVESIPLDTKTAWIDTGIFSEAELLELKKIFTDQANDAYTSIRSIFRSFSIKEIPQFKDNKSDTESMRNDHNDYISRILLFVGVLIEHIEKHPGIDFQIVIKGGITAQILMSLITNGYYIYQTSDIDLKLLPRGDTPYNKELLQKHAEDISDLIYFILGSPTNISILKPEQNTINKEIVKMSFNPKKSMFVAMIDIDFKELSEGVKQYYADSVLQTYPTRYGYYKIQNYEAFIKEKLFFKSYYQILYLRTYECKKSSSNDCEFSKMMIDKFRASSKALMSLYGNNTYEYFYRIYKYYFETMNNYYETKPGFIPSTINNMTIPDPHSKYKPNPDIDYEPYNPEKKL